jgi:hypothetical protein
VKKRWITLLVLGLASLVSSARAQAHPEPRVSLALDTRFGVTHPPFYSERFPSQRGHGFVAKLAGTYRLDSIHQVGALFPAALVSLAQPAGSYVDKATWGNASLFLVQTHTLRTERVRNLRWLDRIDLSLPIAEHGPSDSLYANRALAVASALEGWRDPELFLPGRLSLVATGGVEFAVSRFLFQAGLKLPLLFRVSRAGLPESARDHRVGFTPIAHTLVGVRALSWLEVRAITDLVINAFPAVEQARGQTRPAQLVVEPELLFRLTGELQLATTFMLPVAGALGGSTYAGSASLRASW